MPTNSGVTWKWLVGILATMVISGSGTWMATMYAEVSKVKEDQKADRKAVSDIERKVSVIEEQTKRTQEDVKEIKEGQKDVNKKLDELIKK